MDDTEKNKLYDDKRLSTRLSGRLAAFVDQMTGHDGLYETPSEYIRDLIRRHMESVQQNETTEVNALLAESIQANRYSEWTKEDSDLLRRIAKGEE